MSHNNLETKVETSSYASKYPFVEWRKQAYQSKKRVDAVKADKSSYSPSFNLFPQVPSKTNLKHYSDGVFAKETTKGNRNNFRTTKVLRIKGGKRRRRKTIKRRRRKTIKRRRRKTVKR